MEEQVCQHNGQHFDVFLFERKCDIYEVENGVVIREDMDNETNPTDAVSISCKECGELWEFENYKLAPQWIQELMEIAYVYAYQTGL